MATTSDQPPRTDVLARHRTIVPGHIHDRRSVYWVDNQPLGPPTTFAMTPRLDILSKSRHLLQEYRFNRDKEMGWNYEPFYREIKLTNKNVPEASPRVVALSAHKTPVEEYLYDRNLPTETAKANDASPRVEQLARSKTQVMEEKLGHPDRMFYPYLPQPVSAGAMKTSATPRVEALSDYKKTSAQFKPEKPVRWEVNEQSLKVNASLRVCQLARPNSRALAKEDDFDPYQVPKAARYAVISPRVDELSVPIARKVRSKKA